MSAQESSGQARGQGNGQAVVSRAAPCEEDFASCEGLAGPHGQVAGGDLTLQKG